MEEAAPELECVGGDEECAGGDERQQPERPGERGDDPDRDRAASDAALSQTSTRRRDLRAQRTAVQLVERVRADAEREQERRQPPEQPVAPRAPVPAQRRSRRRRDARACRGRGAASRNRASHPARVHRTPAAARRSPAPAPHDHAAAEAEPPRANVGRALPRSTARAGARGAGAPRGRGCSGRGIAPPRASPARAGVPRPAERPARRAPRARGPRATEGRRTPAAPSFRRAARRGASSLTVAAGSSTYRSRYVTVRASNEASENGSVSARPSRSSILVAEPSGRDATSCDGEHLRAPVDADHRAAVLPDELERDRARSGGHVQHARVRPDLEPRDQEATPARVLAEREEPRVAVVGRAEWREELRRNRAARLRGHGIVRTIFPSCSPRSSRSCAARVSASGKVESTCTRARPRAHELVRAEEVVARAHRRAVDRQLLPPEAMQLRRRVRAARGAADRHPAAGLDRRERCFHVASPTVSTTRSTPPMLLRRRGDVAGRVVDGEVGAPLAARVPASRPSRR